MKKAIEKEFTEVWRALTAIAKRKSVFLKKNKNQWEHVDPSCIDDPDDPDGSWLDVVGHYESRPDDKSGVFVTFTIPEEMPGVKLQHYRVLLRRSPSVAAPKPMVKKPIVTFQDYGGVDIEADEGTLVNLKCWVNGTTVMTDCLVMGSPWAQAHIQQMEELKAELTALKQKHCKHEHLTVTLVTDDDNGFTLTYEQGECQECGLKRLMEWWKRPKECKHKWVRLTGPSSPVHELICRKCNTIKPL